MYKNRAEYHDQKTTILSVCLLIRTLEIFENFDRITISHFIYLFLIPAHCALLFHHDTLINMDFNSVIGQSPSQYSLRFNPLRALSISLF